VEAKGFEWFFEATFARHVNIGIIPEAEKRQYLSEWSQPGAFHAMLNWYRASRVIVPLPGVTLPLPHWLLKAFPKIDLPTLVVWGMRDKALLPVQLSGLEELVHDLEVVRLEDAGHFAPWEAAAQVAVALHPFLAREPASSGGPP
jgi:pimeloyl-ACP methyl ester carboxylesterase